jgi:hypothetical protein
MENRPWPGDNLADLDNLVVKKYNFHAYFIE